MTSVAMDNYSTISNDTPTMVIGILIPISCLVLMLVFTIIIIITVRAYCIKKKRMPSPADERLRITESKLITIIL